MIKMSVFNKINDNLIVNTFKNVIESVDLRQTEAKTSTCS